MGQLNANAKPPVVVSFSESGNELAQKIAAAQTGEAHLYKKGEMDPARALVEQGFQAGRPIIGICAAAILIRFLAPFLADKNNEPPVLAVSSDGKSIVPLLGGHHGANKLAHNLAQQLNAHAAITTASENMFGAGLDEVPFGWTLVNPQSAKRAMATLLAGSKFHVEGEAEWLTQHPAHNPDGKVKLLAHIHLSDAQDAPHYVPRKLVVGVGCERHCPAEKIIELIETTFKANKMHPKAIAALASIDLKADEKGLQQAAAHFGVPLRVFTAAQLAAERDRVPNPSAIVEQEVGTPSVAEAAALKAGNLMVEKQKNKQATCAIGASDTVIDPKLFGRAIGTVYLVGLGPGTATLRTPEADRALRIASDWVGYGLYLDLAADAKTRQKEHRFELGEEELRVRHALELAGSGRDVALICSGDANIFAMGALIYELLVAEGDRALSDAAKRVSIETCPGISAFQAAAAKSGALIGHDFCCISLSDLLTPRDDILKRLDAAAAGDFVTAFYNPRSMRRTDLIEIAKEKFLDARPKDTPVIIASNLGRPAEKVRVVPLADFNPEEIDMLTIVLFGSSQSRSFLRGSGEQVAYTPRGYARKAKEANS